LGKNVPSLDHLVKKQIQKSGSNKGHTDCPPQCFRVPVSCHLRRYVFEIPASHGATNQKMTSLDSVPNAQAPEFVP